MTTDGWERNDLCILVRCVYLDLLEWWTTSTEQRPESRSFWAALRELSFLYQSAFALDELSPSPPGELSFRTWILDNVVAPIADHMIGLAMVAYTNCVVGTSNISYWALQDGYIKPNRDFCLRIADKCLQRALMVLRLRSSTVSRLRSADIRVVLYPPHI